MMNRLRFLLDFRGRIDRAQYWRLALLFSLVLLIVAMIVAFAGAALYGRGHADLTIPFLAALVPISVRRLHDRGRSGWWLLAFFALPIILYQGTDFVGETAATMLLLASLALQIWAAVELGFLKGASGSNRFGADPLKT